MKLTITIDEKTYEVDVDAAEPEPVPAMTYAVGGVNIASAPLAAPAAAPPAPPVGSQPVNEDKV
jgi:hypothetical protein